MQSSTAHHPCKNAIRIFLAPGRLDRRRGRRYNVHLGSPGGEQIVTDALDAMHTACRVLSARGVTGALEVWHVGSDFPAIHIRDIATAARFTVREDGHYGPTLVRYRPRFAPSAPPKRRKAASSRSPSQSENSGMMTCKENPRMPARDD